MINNEKSKGLGDTIAKFTHATKLNKVAEAVAKLAGLEGCGCDERQQYLNELFPYETTTRKFKVLEDFEFELQPYKKGQIIKVTKNDLIHAVVIPFVRDGKIEEI